MGIYINTPARIDAPSDGPAGPELAQLRDVIETIPAIAWAVNPDGSNMIVNKRWREYTGVSTDEVDVGVIPSITHPDDRQRHATICSRALDRGEPFENEIRIRRVADGEYRWFLVRGVPLLESNGRVLKWYAYATDVDDRKRAEVERDRSMQALRRSEAHLAEAQSLSHTGSFGWKVAADEHFWSDETFRIFELAPSSNVSLQRILERVHPQDVAAAKMAIAASAGDGINLELRLMMPDHRLKHLHVVGKANRDESGSTEIIGTVMDITERKKAEEERNRVRLLESERETAIANERSRLAGEIHDTLAQALAMIVMQLADAEVKLGPAWSQAQKPLAMVRELAVESLAYARRSVSVLRPNVATGGLARSIRDIVDSVRRHFPGSLILDVTGEDVLLDGLVESALVGIVREALTNAVKHSNATRITVELNFAHDSVRLVVSDDGTGFDANAVQPDAYGLVSMQERAARAHLALTFVAEPGAGTTIIASWSPAINDGA